MIRDWVSQFFGFDKELRSLDDLLAYKEVEIRLLREENEELKKIIFKEHGITSKEPQTSPRISSPDKPIRGMIPWNKLRRSLEAQPEINPVKIKEAEQEIQDEVNKRNATN